MKARTRRENQDDAYGNSVRYLDQNGYDRTTEDFDQPFGYSVRRCFRQGQVVEPNSGSSIHSFGKGADSIRTSNLPGFDSYVTANLNRAYAKMVDRARDGSDAQLGAFLGEGRETLKMVSKRALQMVTAAKQARRGDLRGMFDTLGVHPKPPHRKPRYTTDLDLTRRTAGNFLEYSYGWVPAVGDIVGACEVLGSTPPWGPIWGSVRDRSNFVRAAGSNAPCPNSNVDERAYVMSRFKVGCHARISNPNAALLTQLGLVNPVAVGWELIPFSFLVDQVYNVGQFLNSWMDFYGWDLTKHYYVHSHRAIYSYSRRQCPKPGHIRQVFDLIEAKRTASQYRPTPVLGGPFNLISSVNRAANNIALFFALLGGNPIR